MRSTDSAISASSSAIVIAGRPSCARIAFSSSIHMRRCIAWTPFFVTSPGVLKKIVPMRLKGLPSASFAKILSPKIFIFPLHSLTANS